MSTNFENIQKLVRRAIAPIRPINPRTKVPENLSSGAKRTLAGRELPPYYLIYFLLVDLLGFENYGQHEKIAWSVPIDFKEKAFLIEHRKFGIGIFVANPESEENDAKQIVTLIKKGVKTAEPYFAWRAQQAVKTSNLNVINNSRWLFNRYKYLQSLYDKLVQDKKNFEGIKYYEIKNQIIWIALDIIEAFFSWTEHIFIHLAILKNVVSTGTEVADLAKKDWSEKFKAVLNLRKGRNKELYDELLEIRRQYRNFVAHGAFGKNGEAFTFHSGAGAVPVTLTEEKGRYLLGSVVDFDEDIVLSKISDFITYLWAGSNKPAYLYVQDSYLPLILSLSKDGTYKKAMKSTANMKDLVQFLSYQFDNAANMDW